MKNKIAVLLIVLILLAGAAYAAASARLFRKSPNVIVILTDDLDNALLPYLPKTNRLIGEQGATFDNYFIPTPLCCPSRASMLRGEYAHNTDILENSPGFPRFFKLKKQENTFNVWLYKAGYRTALYGKYLNNYPVNAGRNYVPPGWSDWGASLGTNYEGDLYYDYTLNENGVLVEYGSDPEDYSTDVIKNKSLAFLRERAADRDPFLLFLSIYAPHGPSTPAPRHANLFNDLTRPRSPAIDEEDLSDKPQIIRALTDSGEDFDEGDADALFQNRARSLQAVDELVEALIQALAQNGQLETTYIFFTSDNGFHMGEHGIPPGKGTAYEEDIRVPFMARGPGIAPGSRISQMTANIDIAPTIADIAGVPCPDFVDGSSFLPFLHGKSVPWRAGLLIEFGYERNENAAKVQNISLGSEFDLRDPETDNLLVNVYGGGFRGIRGGGFLYLEYQNGEIEFYDLKADPYQLENLAGRLTPQTLAALHTKLEALKYCSGQECRILERQLEFDIQFLN